MIHQLIKYYIHNFHCKLYRKIYEVFERLYETCIVLLKNEEIIGEFTFKFHVTMKMIGNVDNLKLFIKSKINCELVSNIIDFARTPSDQFSL